MKLVSRDHNKGYCAADCNCNWRPVLQAKMVKELGGNAVAFTSILEVQALPPHHVAEISYLEDTLHHLSVLHGFQSFGLVLMYAPYHSLSGCFFVLLSL